MDLKPPNPTSRTRDQHHTRRFAVPIFSRHSGMFGRTQLLPPRKEKAKPRLPHAFHVGGEYGLDLASTLQGTRAGRHHIPIYFLRDNVLPFILCQAFYLQLTNFIYLIFTCYVSDLIVHNGLSTLGVSWIWSRQRGKWSSHCLHSLISSCQQDLASEQQDGKIRRTNIKMLFLNRSGKK